MDAVDDSEQWALRAHCFAFSPCVYFPKGIIFTKQVKGHVDYNY